MWMDANPGPKEPPHYRSFGKLPPVLSDLLYGNHARVKSIHSVAIGSNDDFAVSFRPAEGASIFKWHMTKNHSNMDNRLLHVDDIGPLRLAIGPGTEYFECSDKHVHCYCPNVQSLADEATDLGPEEVLMVTFGIGGCGILLPKSGFIGEFDEMDIAENYKDLHEDLLRQLERGAKHREAISVALNPFKKNEYFVAFKDGTIYFNCSALGRGRYPARLKRPDDFGIDVDGNNASCYNDVDYAGSPPHFLYPASPEDGEISVKRSVFLMMEEWSRRLSGKSGDPENMLLKPVRPDSQHRGWRVPRILEPTPKKLVPEPVCSMKGGCWLY